jgi:bacterioferritin-associated ferredoxin
MYVCLCKGLTESDVQQAARHGKVCPDTLKTCFGLEDEDCCGRCAKNIHELVAIANSGSARASTLPMLLQNQRQRPAY